MVVMLYSIMFTTLNSFFGDALPSENYTLKIVFLSHYVSDVDMVTINSTNTSLEITEKAVSYETPFMFARSLRTLLLPAADEVIIMNRELCDSRITDMIPELVDVALTCHGAYTPALPMSACNDNTDLGQEPDGAMDIFGHNNVNPVIKMFPKLISMLEWNMVSIFHDYGMAHAVTTLSDTLSSKGIKAVTYIIDGDVTSDASYRQLLSLYNNTTARNRNLLIICQVDCFNKLLKQANVFDKRNQNKTAIWKFSKWLIYQENVSEVCLTHDLGIDNLALVTVPLPKSSGSFSLDLHQHLHNVYSQCVENATSRGYVTTRHDMVQMLEKDTESWQGRIDTLLYRQEGREFSPVGFFDLEGHLTLNVDVFPNTDFGFNRRTLHVGTNIWDPFVKLSDTTSSGFDGLCFDLLEEISTLLNFTYDATIPADKEFGRVLNGSWTGLILGLEKRELDLAVGPLTVTVERETVMDFTFPFYYDQAVGIYKLPDPNGTKWLKLIRPFKGTVLVCLAISLVAVAALLCVMEMVGSSLKSNSTTSTGNKYFQESLWYLYGAMLSHGGSEQPKSESGRILVGFWWLFCIVIAASYSGTLIASLTVNKEILPFDNIADIASQTDYSWGTVGGSSYVTYFENDPSESNRKIWQGIQGFQGYDNDVLSQSADVHMKKVLEGSYVFFNDNEALTPWKSQHCDLAFIKETFLPFTYALGLPKESPYADIFSNVMLKIDQSGLFLNWRRKWWPQENLCLEEGKASARAIALMDIQSAFYLIAIGIFLAVLALGIEKLALAKYYVPKNDKLNV